MRKIYRRIVDFLGFLWDLACGANIPADQLSEVMLRSVEGHDELI